GMERSLPVVGYRSIMAGDASKAAVQCAAAFDRPGAATGVPAAYRVSGVPHAPSNALLKLSPRTSDETGPRMVRCMYLIGSVPTLRIVCQTIEGTKHTDPGPTVVTFPLISNPAVPARRIMSSSWAWR